MSVQIKVEAVTKEPRIWQGKTTWGVKLPGDGGWVTLYREAKPTKGENIDVNITERNVKGRLYVDAFPVMPPLAPATNGQAGPATTAEVVAPKKDERITWDACREIAKAAHGMALVFEPDEYGDEVAGIAHIRTDKSLARMAFVNTIMIAFTSGKFIVPKDDDGYVAPGDGDDIPPF